MSEMPACAQAVIALVLEVATRKCLRYRPIMVALGLFSFILLPSGVFAQTRPSADVQAGARTTPDMSFLKNVKSRCTYFVSTGGNDNNPGRSTRSAWKTIGKALRTLKAGDVGCVMPGVYNEGENRAENSGTADAPIVLKAVPWATTKPIVKPVGPVAVFEIDQDYWVMGSILMSISRR